VFFSWHSIRKLERYLLVSHLVKAIESIAGEVGTDMGRRQERRRNKAGILSFHKLGSRSWLSMRIWEFFIRDAASGEPSYKCKSTGSHLLQGNVHR
jgi:hypothetical protein